MLEEGDKDKKGGGAAEPNFRENPRTRNPRRKRTEAKMGNIFSAPNRVRKKVFTICTWLNEC